MRKIDPFGSMQGMFSQLQNFMGNPMKFMQQRNMKLSQNINSNNPTAIIQDMMNSGQLSQDQYNYVNQLSSQIQANPQYQQFIQGYMRK